MLVSIVFGVIVLLYVIPTWFHHDLQYAETENIVIKAVF